MIGSINDPRVADSVGSLFGGASSTIRDFVNESFDAEERRERAPREDTYTDTLVSELRNAIARSLEALGGRFRESGVDFNIEFLPVNLPVVEEFRYGADIGIRVQIHTPRVTIVKGLLLQCKRMYGPQTAPTFRELRGRGEEQCKKMLRVTPASFYLLYNGGTQEDLVDYCSVPVGMLCPPGGGRPIPDPKRRRLGTSCPFWSRSAGTVWDMGIAVLPASRLLSWSYTSQLSGRPVPIDAATVLRGCLPFGVFMVDLFASCFVGDPRESVVRIVTPPAIRDRAVPTLGLPDDEFEDFAVRNVLNITIESDNDNV